MQQRYEVSSHVREGEEEDEDITNDPWFEDEDTNMSPGKDLQQQVSLQSQEHPIAHRHKESRSMDKNDRTLSEYKSRDDLNGLYSSGIPRSSNLGSRNHPLGRLSGLRKTQFSLNSPQDFNTAPSSVASYVTATSGSRTASGASTSHTVRQVGRATEEPQSRTTIFLSLPEIVNKFVIQMQWTLFRGARLPPSLDLEAFRSHVADVVLAFSLPYSSTQHDVASLDEAVERILAFTTPHLGTSPSHETALKLEKLGHDMRTVLHQQTTSYDGPYKINVGKVFTSEWLNYLDTKGILLDPRDELDWSGRGQHVEYELTEESTIPLTTDSILGHSATAIVDRVKCRRIMLARKKIRCRGRLTKKEAIKEVEHLQQLQHTHIVRVVGTYTRGKDLAILIYPAARWNLEEFLESIEDEGERLKTDVTRNPWLQWNRRVALLQFVGCLANAMAFIHSKNIKHMDIKPTNCLIQNRSSRQYRVYIADFGIARAYKSYEDSETDSPISFTRTYAAPEVILQETRGFSADIFSLGCVYMEVLATMLNQRHDLHELRLANRADATYQANSIGVTEWCRSTVLDIGYCCPKTGESIHLPHHVTILIMGMLHVNPSSRPLAPKLKEDTAHLSCTECDTGPEPFEAASVEESRRAM